MQSNNPILNRVEVYADYSQPMTVQGDSKVRIVDFNCRGAGFRYFLLQLYDLKYFYCL